MSSLTSGQPATAATAVLDTNVWLDWLVFNDRSIASLAIAFERATLIPLATMQIRAEFEDVVRRPFFTRWIERAQRPSSESAATWLQRFDACARLCPEPIHCGFDCSDPDDQMFIDLAVAQRAQWLLSRDRAVLKLARKAANLGVTITQPEAFKTQEVR